MNRISTSTEDRVNEIIKTAYIEAAALEAAESILDSDQCGEMEFCHLLWTTQKKILKEKYGVEWESPMQNIYAVST